MTVEEKADHWVLLKSTNLKAAGTIEDYLVVQFQNGVYYRYPDLAHHFTDLITAPSAGKYFKEHIREESCERLKGDEWPEEDDV